MIFFFGGRGGLAALLLFIILGSASVARGRPPSIKIHGTPSGFVNIPITAEEASHRTLSLHVNKGWWCWLGRGGGVPEQTAAFHPMNRTLCWRWGAGGDGGDGVHKKITRGVCFTFKRNKRFHATFVPCCFSFTLLSESL